MKINKSTKFLLFEAYRRNHMNDVHEQSEPLERRWLGLGTKSVYAPALNAGLMRFHDDELPPPRCMGWLVLTPAGIQAMHLYEEEFAAQLDRMKISGYERSYLAQYTIAGGLVRA